MNELLQAASWFAVFGWIALGFGLAVLIFVIMFIRSFRR